MPKHRSVPGFWLNIDKLEEARTTLIAELGWRQGMLTYAAHVRLFTWQYATARPIKDASHVARILGCDPRVGRNLWANLGAILPRTYTHRSDGSYCKRTLQVLDNYDKKQEPTGATSAPKSSGDSYSYSEEEDKTKKKDTSCPKKKVIFKPPSIEEVEQYCQERGGFVDPRQWWDFYQGKGWMVGKNRMKDCRAAVRTWERNGKGRRITENSSQHLIHQEAAELGIQAKPGESWDAFRARVATRRH